VTTWARRISHAIGRRPTSPPAAGGFALPKLELPKLDSLGGGEPAVEQPRIDVPEDVDDVEDDKPAASTGPIDTATGEIIGAGVTGVVAGGILADIALGAAGVGLTGELLTDAAVVGAVALGGAAVYATTQPDEAGEAARFVGGSVANVTSAYTEVAALNAELAILEQKRNTMAKVDKTVANVKAAPGKAKANIERTVTKSVDAAVSAPGKAIDSLTNSIATSLRSAQDKAKSELDAAKKQLDKLQE